MSTTQEVTNSRITSVQGEAFGLKRDTTKCTSSYDLYTYLNWNKVSRVGYAEMPEDSNNHKNKTQKLICSSNITLQLRTKLIYFISQCAETKESPERKMYFRQRFEVVCIYTVEARRVWRLIRILAYCDVWNTVFTLRRSNASFRKGINVFCSDGKLKIRIPGEWNEVIEIDVNVSHTDTPLPVSLEVIEDNRLLILYLKNSG